MPRMRPIQPIDTPIDASNVSQNMTSAISVTPVHLQHPPPEYVNPPAPKPKQWEQFGDAAYLDATGLETAETALDEIDGSKLSVKGLFLGVRKRIAERRADSAESKSRDAISAALASLSGARAHTTGASSFVPQAFTPLDAVKPVLPNPAYIVNEGDDRTPKVFANGKTMTDADGNEMTVKDWKEGRQIQNRSVLKDDLDYLQRTQTFARLAQRYNVTPVPNTNRQDATDVELMHLEAKRLEENLEARDGRGKYPVGLKDVDKRHPYQQKRARQIVGRVHHDEHVVHDLDDRIVSIVYRDGKKAARHIHKEAKRKAHLDAINRALDARKLLKGK